MAKVNSLAELPQELLRSILFFLPPESLPSVELTSRHFRTLVNDPLLWRERCSTGFTYWEQETSPFHKTLQGQAPSVRDDDGHWKKLYIHRRKQDRFVESCLERVIANQRCRIEQMQEIIKQGYEAKAVLLKNCLAPDDAEDVLARRYWSLEILNAMQRRKGIRVWTQVMKEGKELSLEEALGAFDMFVLDTREGDISDITTRLDQLAKQFRAAVPALAEMSTRQKAVEIARFVRAQDLVGIYGDDEYHILRNRFLGLALFDEEHQALPLISVAIYCCIAQRLGVNAQPCNFPFHVHASVSSAKGFNLDGKKLDSDDQVDCMFMDPFKQEEEVGESKLRSLLSSIGAQTPTHAEILTSSSAEESILRTARNIATSVQSGETTDPPRRSLLSSWNTGLPDTDGAFYGALWSMILFDPERRRNYLHHIVQFFQQGFTVDVDLMENTIFPMFRRVPEGQGILKLIQEIRNGDSSAKPVVRRTANSSSVKYRVGQVFEHRRYHYEGVIIGWDNLCRASEAWMRQMDVDRLNNGRHQSFYHVLVADKSSRYVAEENIGISKHEPSANMMKLAGQYFKRWDEENGAFVSNIRDEYPDD